MAPLVKATIFATLQNMKRLSHHTIHIVTAVLLAVGFSIPVAWADEARVDELFTELLDADAATTDVLIEEITAEWSKSGSAAVDLLLQRGIEARDMGDPARAVEHFTAAIDHAPDFAEAYSARAEVYYLTDDIGPAIADLTRTLDLNPRHFGAQIGLAVILNETGQDQKALDLFREIQAILPHYATVADAIRSLSSTLEGQTL